MEYGFGYVIIRSPYTPYSIYLRGTIDFWVCVFWLGAWEQVLRHSGSPTAPIYSPHKLPQNDGLKETRISGVSTDVTGVLGNP